MTETASDQGKQLLEQMHQKLQEASSKIEEAAQKIKNQETEVKKMEEDKQKAEQARIEAEKARAETERKLIEEEKARIVEVQKKQEDELKRRELEQIRFKELEMKERELTEIKTRLAAIEQEREEQKRLAHEAKVRGVVDKMVKSGVITDSEIDTKFNSLKVLSEPALMEVSSVIEKRLINEPATRVTQPSQAPLAPSKNIPLASGTEKATRTLTEQRVTSNPGQKPTVADYFAKLATARR